jgi:hypothetical protein
VVTDEQRAAALETSAVVDRILAAGELTAVDALKHRELRARVSPDEYLPLVQRMMVALNRDEVHLAGPEVHFCFCIRNLPVAGRRLPVARGSHPPCARPTASTDAATSASSVLKFDTENRIAGRPRNTVGVG